MLAFEITINGKVICTAGAGPNHRVLATILSWTHRDPDRIAFNVGGVPETDQHLGFNVPDVSIGDEITIRIIDTDAVDEPDQIRAKLDRNDWIARLDSSFIAMENCQRWERSAQTNARMLQSCSLKNSILVLQMAG